MHTICLLEYDITYQSSNLHIFTDKYLKWLENTVAYIYILKKYLQTLLNSMSFRT